MKKQKKKRDSKKLWNQRKPKNLQKFQEFKKLQSNFQKGFALFILGGLAVLVLIYFIWMIWDKYV